jgi:chorismate dehydratase
VAVAPTLAASVYLNSAPLVYAFAEGTQSDRCVLLGHEAPSRCAGLLEEGSVDGALIPAVEYQRIPGLAVARDVCVAARERVQSVLLVARRPLAEIGSVALDTSSRTSAALVRILLERFHGVSASYAPAEPDLAAMLARHDAALMIGDPAMTADTRGYEVHDLAALWRERTGLPFVFAVWAVRPGRIEPAALDFAAARDEGVRAAPQLAGRYARRLGLPRERLLDYLTSSIHYRLDAESLEGLALYYKLAAETGLIPAPKPLRFWPD